MTSYSSKIDKLHKITGTKIEHYQTTSSKLKILLKIGLYYNQKNTIVEARGQNIWQ